MYRNFRGPATSAHRTKSEHKAFYTFQLWDWSTNITESIKSTHLCVSWRRRVYKHTHITKSVCLFVPPLWPFFCIHNDFVIGLYRRHASCCFDLLAITFFQMLDIDAKVLLYSSCVHTGPYTCESFLKVKIFLLLSIQSFTNTMFLFSSCFFT